MVRQREFEDIIETYRTLFIGYTNREGDYHEFNIRDVEYPVEEYGNNAEDYFNAYVIDEDGQPEGICRTFRIDRIDFMEESELNDEDEDEDEDYN